MALVRTILPPSSLHVATTRFSRMVFNVRATSSETFDAHSIEAEAPAKSHGQLHSVADMTRSVQSPKRSKYARIKLAKAAAAAAAAESAAHEAALEALAFAPPPADSTGSAPGEMVSLEVVKRLLAAAKASKKAAISQWRAAYEAELLKREQHSRGVTAAPPAVQAVQAAAASPMQPSAQTPAGNAVVEESSAPLVEGTATAAAAGVADAAAAAAKVKDAAAAAILEAEAVAAVTAAAAAAAAAAAKAAADAESEFLHTHVELRLVTPFKTNKGVMHLTPIDCATQRNSVLTIHLGDAETAALARGLASQPSRRPMTHDLFITALACANLRIDKVVINRFDADTYYANIHIIKTTAAMAGAIATPSGSSSDGTAAVPPVHRHVMDARPSDAVNLAVRTGAKVFATQQLMADKGVSRS